ncbi:MAG: glycosyltransferase family A protein [Coxiellaceae bacterium]|nr:glycosyltransferase family A protein [Coxiellaceae bacterium]
MQPLISIIVPAYNAERFITDAINSLLNQTYTNIEIIIIDDESTDNTLAIARSFPNKVRVYSQTNSGPAAARNTGISKAKGELFAFLDADDTWGKNKLTKQQAVLQENPNIDMVFGHVKQNQTILSGISHITLLVRKTSYLKVGNLETEWKCGEFIDWYARAKDLGLQEHLLDEVVASRRIHDDNLGIREKNKRSDYLKVIKATLDRRRAKA